MLNSIRGFKFGHNYGKVSMHVHVVEILANFNLVVEKINSPPAMRYLGTLFALLLYEDILPKCSA